VPVYEYRCKKCGYQFERIQKMSEPPERRCERCGGSVAKLISSSGLMFKGAGWYVTDYSKKLKEDKKEKNGEKDKKEAAKPATSSNKPPDK